MAGREYSNQTPNVRRSSGSAPPPVDFEPAREKAEKALITPRERMGDSTHKTKSVDSQGRSPATTKHPGMGLRSATIQKNIRKATPKR